MLNSLAQKHKQKRDRKVRSHQWAYHHSRVKQAGNAHPSRCVPYTTDFHFHTLPTLPLYTPPPSPGCLPDVDGCISAVITSHIMSAKAFLRRPVFTALLHVIKEVRQVNLPHCNPQLQDNTHFYFNIRLVLTFTRLSIPPCWLVWSLTLVHSFGDAAALLNPRASDVKPCAWSHFIMLYTTSTGKLK